MALFEITSRFAAELGLEPPEADGTLAFTLDEDLELEICPVSPEGDFVLSAPVCALPDVGRAQLYETVLAASLYGHETGGAAIGVDLNHRDLVLWRGFSESAVSEASFAEDFARFVAALRRWRAWAARGFDAPASSIAERPPSSEWTV